MTTNFSSIPIVDFALSTSSASKPRFLSDLRDAIVKVGFLYLKNHSIPENVQQELLRYSTEFFNQSPEDKLESDMTTNKHYLGYVGMNSVESEFATVDHREIFVLGKDQPAPGPDKPIHWNLRGPNPWPQESKVPGFRTAIETYYAEVERLAENFKVLIAEALELEATAFSRLFDKASTDRIMLAKYPQPTSSPASDDGTFYGIGTHKDSSFLTFLLPGTMHSGLEVQNHSGVWIPASPKPGHLIVNIGQQLDALTKGVCRATTHRVGMNMRTFYDENGHPRGDRYSFPYFQVLGLDLTPEAASIDIPAHIMELVKDDKVKSDAAAYFRNYFKNGIGRGVLAARALKYHVVTEKFYPGLLEELKASKEIEAGR